jgi:hypothetical protein
MSSIMIMFIMLFIVRQFPRPSGSQRAQSDLAQTAVPDFEKKGAGGKPAPHTSLAEELTASSSGTR